MTTSGIVDLPQITWRPLTRPGPEIIPVALVGHTAVSGAKSLWNYFNSPAAQGNSSHFYVLPDGSGEQYVPVTQRANANGAGNRWWEPARGAFVGAVSIETWDGGNPQTPWTPAQVDTMADIALWLHQRFGMSLDLCTTPTSGGIGWHSMWPAPNPWSPGNHTCPGPVRIAQFQNQLVPLIYRKQIGDNPEMATTPTLDLAAYVRGSYAAAGNTDAKGIQYWILLAAQSDDWAKVLHDMNHQLGLA